MPTIPSKLNTHLTPNYVDFFSELSKIIKNTNVTKNDITCTNNNNLSEPSNIVISTSIPASTPASTPSSTPASEYDDICLISKEKLHPNHITLECKHKFNYIHIYKEVLYQKTKSNTLYEVTKLQPHQIKCPYCRTITNKLLPYIPYPSVHNAKNIHSSYPDCIHTSKCSHTTKKAGDINTPCEKNALFYETENILLCPSHYKQYVSKREKELLKTTKNESTNNTEKVNVIKKKDKDDHHHKCQAILKSGVNKGHTCNSIINIDGLQYCKRHS